MAAQAFHEDLHRFLERQGFDNVYLVKLMREAENECLITLEIRELGTRLGSVANHNTLTFHENELSITARRLGVSFTVSSPNLVYYYQTFEALLGDRKVVVGQTRGGDDSYKFLIAALDPLTELSRQIVERPGEYDVTMDGTPIYRQAQDDQDARASGHVLERNPAIRPNPKYL